jgi:ribosomal protein S18 acetylase RimI-like enzyme
MARSAPPPFELRGLEPSDREAIGDAVRRTGFFGDAEVAVALELVDHALKRPGQRDYRFIVAVDPGFGSRFLGYACFGPTPMTEGTFDLYWIVVAPEAQGRGIGKALQEAAWAAMRDDGGRMVIVETSSREQYAPTRAFYLATGHEEVCRIDDFYRPGDGKVIFRKGLR